MGAIEERPDRHLLVTVARMRAVVASEVSHVVEARFTYLGPTAETAPLGSGEVRRQFGLKLRALDGCNFVYAMWRIAPQSKLVVSVKRNPGMHTHAECGTRGYRNVKPRLSRPVPELKLGDTHRIRAEMVGEEMKIHVEGGLV